MATRPAASGPGSALRRYRDKRDFASTPEPTGKARRQPSGAAGGQPTRFFCIQLHLASHLHFDFRLEDQGVLRSWAVPKGLSRHPEQRRLAIQVEDHPYDYGQFSGIIPSGYGAGIVALWDQGLWQPLVTDLAAAWRRGHLSLLLCGTRMKGAWTLVRGHDRSQKAWFLIKQQDEWAAHGTAPDIAHATLIEELAQVVARQPTPPWPAGPPQAGGATGALFRQVLARAALLRRAHPTSGTRRRHPPVPPASGPAAPRPKPARRASKRG